MQGICTLCLWMICFKDGKRKDAWWPSSSRDPISVLHGRALDRFLLTSLLSAHMHFFQPVHGYRRVGHVGNAVFILGQYDKVYLLNLELSISGHVATLAATDWFRGLPVLLVVVDIQVFIITHLVGEGRGLATIVLSSLG